MRERAGKVREMRPEIVEAAQKIWAICKISPEMGNAVMDTIGCDAYDRVAWIVRAAEIEEGRKHVPKP